MTVREYYTEQPIKGFPSACSQNEKVSQFIELLKDPDVQSFLKVFVDNAIATSELQILKRLNKVEKIVGFDDDEPDETADLTLPQMIKSIEDKVNSSINSFKPPTEPEIQPTTKTEERAVLLFNHAKEKGKDHLTAREITSFLKGKLPDSCKIKENIKNVRKVKQDVLEKAKEMYPNVILSKKETGHHEVRLVLGLPS